MIKQKLILVKQKIIIKTAALIAYVYGLGSLDIYLPSVIEAEF